MAINNKKELNGCTIRKPNQTVLITNGDITATQRKAYNVLLHKAQQDLKLDKNKFIFSIPIAEIEEKSGIQDTNNKRLKEDLESLMKVMVKCVRENKTWAAFVLISQICKEGDLLQFEFPSIIRESLIKGDYYTTLDLMILKTLNGKYAIILYELAMRYHKVEIPKLTIEEFRSLTGMESYRDFKEIRKKCIEPGLSEINEKSDIIIDYIPYMVGRKVVSIKFNVIQKGYLYLDKNQEDCFSTTSKSNTPFNTELFEKLKSFFCLTENEAIDRLKKFDELIIKEAILVVEDDIKKGISGLKNKIRDIRAYTIKAIDEGWQPTNKKSLFEVEAEEKEKQKKIEEEKKRLESERIEKLKAQFELELKHKALALFGQLNAEMQELLITACEASLEHFLFKNYLERGKKFEGPSLESAFNQFVKEKLLPAEQRDFDLWLRNQS